MMSLVDRRRELEAQREVRSWPRQQVKQGQSLDVEAGVSTGITPPTDEDVQIDDVVKE